MKYYFCYILIILLLIKNSELLAQKQDWNRNLSIGSTITYFQNQSPDFGTYLYHEWTLRMNASIRVMKRYHQGIDYLKIYTQSVISGKNQYSLLGVFSQYDILYLDNRGRIWGELGYYNGNYCKCGNGDPYLKNNLSYLSLGAGVDYKLYKFLYINFGFQNKTILNPLKVHKYAYNLYVLGLNVVLEGKNKK